MNAPRSTMLAIDDNETLGDLQAWAADHASDPRTEGWLVALAPESFPVFSPVPPEIAGDVIALVDDWAEVLGSQGEDVGARYFQSTPLEGAPQPITLVLKTNCAPVINEIFASVPGVQLVIVDEDIEGCGDESIAQIEGEQSWVGVYEVEQDPERAHAVLAEAVAGLGVQ